MMNCPLCSSKSTPVKKLIILRKYSGVLYLCPTCDLLFFAEPNWLQEAYAAPINVFDTGLIARNLEFSHKLSYLFKYFFPENMKGLDYAGGYGIFVRLMRDKGFDFYWSDAYAQNLVARGFEQKKGDTFTVITAFEFFEHSTEPGNDLEKLGNLGQNLIFSTVLRQELVPEDGWWYYGLEHGQHISFYSRVTLEFMAKKLNRKLITDNTWLHMLLDSQLECDSMHEFLKTGNLVGEKAWLVYKNFHKPSLRDYIRRWRRKFNYNPQNDSVFESLTWNDHLKLKEDFFQQEVEF